MALVYPFKGFRYNSRVVGNLDATIAQPYDKTTPSMQDAYYRGSPYNVVRVTFSREKNADPETSYPQAGAAFRSWIEEGALVQDSLPSMYAYYQEHPIEGQARIQKGFISLLDLKSAGSGIKPHEHTLAAPKQDRLRLMRSVEGNEDLIYMLYQDEKLTVDRIMDAAVSGRTPDIDVTDEYGAVHKVWAIADSEAVRGIQEAMNSHNLFIADGHHRFETSVNFMHECQEKGWRPSAAESFDKRMIACFNSSAGVTILPTHRLLRDLPAFEAAAFLSSIRECFEIELVGSADELWARMKKGSSRNVFGFYPAALKSFYLLTLKDAARNDPALRAHSEAYRKLDVSILHTMILDRFLGIDKQKLEAQAHIDYERERATSIGLVDSGAYQAAFFVNPTRAEQMLEIAALGERMPQKSTDFYPKLLTGLVFMQMQIAKR